MIFSNSALSPLSFSLITCYRVCRFIIRMHRIDKRFRAELGVRGQSHESAFSGMSNVQDCVGLFWTLPFLIRRMTPFRSLTSALPSAGKGATRGHRDSRPRPRPGPPRHQEGKYPPQSGLFPFWLCACHREEKSRIRISIIENVLTSAPLSAPSCR